MTGRERLELWLRQSAENGPIPLGPGPLVVLPGQRDRVTALDDLAG